MKGLKTEWQALPRGCVAPGSRIRFRTFQSGLSKGGTAFLVGENTISFGKSTKECDPENCFFQLVLYQKKWSKFRQDDLRSLDHQRFASSPKSHSPMHRDAVVSRFSSVALKPWSTVSRPISLFLEVHSISILDTLHLHKWSYSKCILHYTPKKLPWKWKANHLKMVSLVGNGDVSSQSCYFSGGGGRYMSHLPKIQAPNPISPNQGARSNIQVQRPQPQLHWQCPSTTFHIRLGSHLSQFHLKSLLRIW